MAAKYFCAHCDYEFVPEDDGDKPRCPNCMRRGGVEPVKAATFTKTGPNRGLVILALLLVAAGIGYAIYRSTEITLEETPPLRALEDRELAAYLERDQIQVGKYESMFVLPGAEEWPADAAALATRLRGEAMTWSLDHPLPRDVFTADETLGALDASEERVRVYPLEAAVAMTALLRKHGVRAMVAEAWAFEDEPAPPDPQGLFGYFGTAVFEGDAEEPTGFFDPWGGRAGVTPASMRVLRDTEVLGAALGADAMRRVTRGNGPKALPLVETGLLLDPVSPALRSVHATVLLDTGGVSPGVQEFEAAVQLRPDPPRKLNLAQVQLGQAAMLQMAGQMADAEAQLTKASRVVTEVLDSWPDYARAHLTAALMHLVTGEPERARVELEVAEKLDPEAAGLWTLWAQYFVAKQDFDSAAAKIKRAVALRPDDWQLQMQAAHVLMNAQDEDGAREHVQRAMDLVSPDKRGKVRQYIAQTLGPSFLEDAPMAEVSDEPLELPEPTAQEPADPALNLGDPSKIRLRDPGEELELDLGE